MELTESLCKSTINSFTSRIHEAENILRYSFFLNAAFQTEAEKTDKITGETISDTIDVLLQTIIKDCRPFFSPGDCNFFGYKGVYQASTKECEDLSVLCMHSPFWEHAIKQDVILFAFDRLRKVIGESRKLSYPDVVRFSNYTLPINEDTSSSVIIHYGLDFLTSEKVKGTKDESTLVSLNVDPQGIPYVSDTLCKINSGINNTVFDEESTNSKRRIRTLYKNIQLCGLNVKPLYLNPSVIDTSMANATTSTFEFYDFLVSRRKPHPTWNILPIFNAHTVGKPFLFAGYTKYITTVHKLLTSINAKEIDKDNVQELSDTTNKLTLSDRIYLRYQIEKIFAPSTINCLYQNIVATRNQVYSLCDQDSVDFLASCLKLPNVFTRQYILQMAIDTIAKHYDYDFGDSDFFSNKKEVSALVTYSHSKTSYSGAYVKLNAWKIRYRNLINYLSQIVFPIFENYFFCSLWDMLKRDTPDATDADNAVKMYALLRDYLNNAENAHDLFDTDNKIINSKPALKDFDSKKIIHPILKYEATSFIDFSLYKQCLISHTLTFKDGFAPDFISLEYLNSLSSRLKEIIQNSYILECSGYTN